MIARKKLAAFFLVLIAGHAAALGAGAQSLRDIRAQEAEERALAREAAYTSDVCDRPISASINWSRSRDWPPRESLSDACDGALGAVETICRAGKKNVVHNFVCSGDGSGASLAGKTLSYGASPGSNGYAATLATIGAAD